MVINLFIQVEMLMDSLLVKNDKIENQFHLDHSAFIQTSSTLFRVSFIFQQCLTHVFTTYHAFCKILAHFGTFPFEGSITYCME